MNEGWATFWHYTILNRLHEQGLVDDGFMLGVPEEPHQRHRAAGVRFEALRRAQSVRARLRDVPRPAADLRDVRTPRTASGSRQLAGTDWKAYARLRDAQLQGRIVHRPVPVAAPDPRVPPVRRSPITSAEDALQVDSIHDERGYRTRAQAAGAGSTRRRSRVPDVQVVRYDRDGDRSLTLRHLRAARAPAQRTRPPNVVAHLRRLWGFAVRLETWEQRRPRRRRRWSARPSLRF